MKYVWLGIAIFSLLLGIHKSMRSGVADAYMFAIFTVIALIMYFIRDYMSKQDNN